ncbi:hypothetical protein ACIREE_32760 [Streptomyces sp. NPDC102467]|uniref:hypothetical protein n=1 Tax=Streptomyces sp. NPDC102467 TaxID=3366179 RepID=UPI003815EA74
MSDSQPSNSSVKNQYAAQVAADLDRNTKEQERVAGELESLQAQLTSLRDDRAILVNMQQALGSKENADAPVKPQRTSAAKTSSKTDAKNSTPKAKPAQSAAKVPAPRADKAASSAQPTLVALVQEYLKQQSEPRSAAEVTEALTAAHPGRSFKKPVVRTTVEGQVAKGLAQRSKQGSSVFYSTPDKAKSPQSAAE